MSKCTYGNSPIPSVQIMGFSGEAQSSAGPASPQHTREPHDLLGHSSDVNIARV
jgi:hypothetical protein